MLLLIELVLCFIAVLLALVWPRLGDGWFTAFERGVARFAARRHLAVLTIFLLALGTRIAVLPIEPIPAPIVHDEFSYLLMGDTFAHGRLTNPPHAMWKHFETFHVIWHPTYTSMFYPGQGAFLALGQVVFGHPFWGVWLSTGLMCAAFCWAMQGWMPPSWAFLGGILAIFRLGTFSYWVDSYWGGSVAAIGGALALGAVPRIKRMRWPGSIAMGFGLALLANTRPYEAVFYSIPILAAVLMFVLSSTTKFGWRTIARRVILPLGCVLVLTGAFMGYYFWRTTGNAFRPPYVVDRETYHLVHFPWEKADRNPQFRFPEQRAFHQHFVLKTYDEMRTPKGFATTAAQRFFRIWQFFVGPILTMPLLALAFVLPPNFHFRDLSRKSKLLLAPLAFSSFGFVLPTQFVEHYVAPIACLIFALILFAMRTIWVTNRHMGSPRSTFFMRSTVIIVFLVAIVRCWIQIDIPYSSQGIDSYYSIFLRAKIDKEVSALPGKHLILVQYAPDHNFFCEWVYNSADIDNAKVVWAHEMGPADNNELISYFNDRKVWLVQADEVHGQLRPYSTEFAVSSERR